MPTNHMITMARSLNLNELSDCLNNSVVANLPKFHEFQLYTNFTHCSHCNLPPRDAKLLTCSNCASAAYHNATCQRSHWKVHKRSCKLLSQSLVPLKELIHWSQLFNIRLSQQQCNGGVTTLLMEWCWWQPNDKNGITCDTIQRTNHIWNVAVEQWHNEDYLRAMEGMQFALEVYQKAWQCVGEERLETPNNDDGEERDNGIGISDNEQVMNDKSNQEEEEFISTSIILAKRLLFVAYCELDGGQIASARHRLVQCISIANALQYSVPASNRTHRTNNHQSLQSILNDAYMELMLSMEEVESDKILARHVANFAIANGNCCGWVDPMQRPGYMASGTVQLSSIPICPVNERPKWCDKLEDSYDNILEEYSNTMKRKQWMDVGCGQRGSGHDDHSVVSGQGWKEYVLFGTGALDRDDDAPFTKKLLRQFVPDAVTLAREGGGEVIFSRLSPRTHIKPHCGPTNLRWTAHLGLVVPKSKSDCRIRVGNEWMSWSAGKVIVFDDSFEHEVKNDTDEERVVLLIRLWHPDLIPRNGFASQLVEEAIARKEESVQKRYCPPSLSD